MPGTAVGGRARRYRILKALLTAFGASTSGGASSSSCNVGDDHLVEEVGALQWLQGQWTAVKCFLVVQGFGEDDGVVDKFKR